MRGDADDDEVIVRSDENAHTAPSGASRPSGTGDGTETFAAPIRRLPRPSFYANSPATTRAARATNALSAAPSAVNFVDSTAITSGGRPGGHTMPASFAVP